MAVIWSGVDRAAERQLLAVGKTEPLQGNPLGQFVRDELPAVQRRVFQFLPLLEHVVTRLELQRVRVAAADGRDLLLDFVRSGIPARHVAQK